VEQQERTDANASPAPAKPPPVRTQSPPTLPQAAATALVTLAISPWGEVFVDGKAAGISPPLSELELARGKHRIVVRNGQFKAYQQDVELGSNETIKIKHKFAEQR
jgi:eukaryotic-like serine/threonine-protein kinase